MLKRYKVQESFQDAAVVLEVDHSVLTEELATELMSYWSGGDGYIRQEGNSVRAAIRLAGLTVLRLLQADGGGDFDDEPRSPFGPQNDIWTRELHRAEGWGRDCGIRCISGHVEALDYDYLELEEVEC